MSRVHGLAADVAWRKPLATSARAAAVGSSFEHAINLDLGGELLTVLGATGRQAPGALLTSAVSFPPLPIDAAVEIGSGDVRIGELEIDVRGCEFYSCATVPVADPAIAVDAGLLRRTLDRYAVHGSFRLGPDPLPFDRAMNARLTDAAGHYRRVLAAARHEDQDEPMIAEQTVGAAVTGLIGLGGGLTPSGDDYLVGALAALWHLPRARRVASAVGRAVLASATTTTAESRHFLLAAAGGCFHRDLADATTAALTSSADLAVTFDRVTRIGFTSGTDALHGLVDTVGICAADSPTISDAVSSTPKGCPR